VDVDEFYRAEEMERVLRMLRDDAEISAVTFKQITFWGGLRYWTDGWYLRRGATYYDRLFKWGPGYTYATHRPPTVLDTAGRDQRKVQWIDGETMAKQGVRLYHYSLLLPKQVIEKCDYYSNAAWAARSGAVRWAQDVYLSLKRPYRVHNVYAYPSWLERYDGPHPEQVERMMSDLSAGIGSAQVRRTDDIERLLASPYYRAGRHALKVLDPVDRRLRALLTPVLKLPYRALSRLRRLIAVTR
jgi:hypothetical protein